MEKTAYERIDSLDLIRGFAIPAILIMNVNSMALPPVAYWVPTWTVDSGTWDIAVFWVQSLFVESRFMSIFTMLFGVGLALQADRMRAKELDPRPRLRRRLAWLLVFGLIHGFLLWPGDILTLYAVAGFIALPATRWKAKRQMTVGIILVVLAQIPLLLTTWGAIMTGENFMGVPDLPLDAAAIDVLRTQWTTLPARLTVNANEFLSVILTVPLFLLWNALGTMMIGMALYRRGFYGNPEAPGRGIVALVIGFLVGLGVTLARRAVGLESSAAQSLLGLMTIAGILMGIGYSSLLVRVAARKGPLARALMNTGKTAFTVYILQTVITLLLFSVILAPRWGTWSRPFLFAYVLVFAVIQVLFANWWQNNRGAGPLEALWRRLAYGRLETRSE